VTPEHFAIIEQIRKIRFELDTLERQLNAAIEPDQARGISEARLRTRLELTTAPFRYARSRRD
jgi:hypothetical protein